MPTTEELTKTEILKQYLLEKENAYLLDDNNNGKTIMLSGAWGSGKTHFWQHEIEPELKNKLQDKACVYVSLYGKESLSDIKSDVYLSANGKNILSTEVSTFGIEALSAIKDSDLAIGKAAKAGMALFDSKKIQKGIAKLKKGGIICFDDFERKSKNVDLNDLFGFISQLAINLECKVIIILNSDVFKDKEAAIFTRVKEKTINKYFNFNPSFEELFKSIAKSSKYSELDNYKANILFAIKETKELNARIYIQILDNCLEWVQVKKSIPTHTIRSLILNTFNFVLNHLILDYNNSIGSKNYNIVHYPGLFGQSKSLFSLIQFREVSEVSEEIFFDKLKNIIFDVNSDEEANLLDNEQQEYLNWLYKNESKLKAIWKYGYLLHSSRDIEEEEYNQIINFIETGILLP